MASTAETPVEVSASEAQSSAIEEIKAEAKSELALKKNAASSPKKAKVAKPDADAQAPFHLLMLPVSEQPQTQLLVQPALLTDRNLRRDYLARRYRAYHMKPASPDCDSASFPALTTSDTTLWSGASSVERALVGCCELPPLEEAIAAEMLGGSLAKGYEVRFAGLVAKHCHNFKDRVLALAILERTLEQDQQDAKGEQEQGEEEQKKEEGKDSEDPTEEDMEGDQEESDEQPDDDDDEWDPKNGSPPKGSTRRSTRIQRNSKRRRIQPKKAKKEADAKPQAAKSTGESKPEESEEAKDSNADRMTVFFSAGGLKILKTWLMDAMTPVYMPMVKGKTTSKPSQCGLMLLPLLHLLSKIPFDKNLIVESKINKQIRKLSKHVDGLIDIFKKQNKSKEGDELKSALDDYQDPGAGGCVVIRVQGILNELKSTWEEHAKNSPVNGQQATVKDPFASLKTKLRAKLGELNDLEAGKIENKPEWLTKCEEVQRERERKRPRGELPTSAVAAKKAATTQQLALKEREAERAALKNKLKAAQEERKAHLQRLKNQINKRIHGTSSGHEHGTRAVTKKKKSGKTVKWKDGLSSDKQKNKDVLEEVFILPKDSLQEEAERQKEEDQKMEAEQPKEEPPKEEEEEELPPPDDMEEDDDEDLFEYDDTFLL